MTDTTNAETPNHRTIELERVRAALKEFEGTQLTYKEYGARDTEPDSIFQQLIWRAAHGHGPAIPRTAAAWELYASSMDCTVAANALHDAALKCVQAVEAVPLRDYNALQKLIRDYCWRIS